MKGCNLISIPQKQTERTQIPVDKVKLSDYASPYSTLSRWNIQRKFSRDLRTTKKWVALVVLTSSLHHEFSRM
jgi:hypothetical protein